MFLLDELAERRIAEAAARGELDGLPGAGGPLPPDPVDPLVPAPLRPALRLLHASGHLPAEALWLRELRRVEQLVQQAEDAEAREAACGRLRLLLSRLEEARAMGLRSQEAYFQRLRRRLARDGGSP